MNYCFYSYNIRQNQPTYKSFSTLLSVWLSESNNRTYKSIFQSILFYSLWTKICNRFTINGWNRILFVHF